MEPSHSELAACTDTHHESPGAVAEEDVLVRLGEHRRVVAVDVTPEMGQFDGSCVVCLDDEEFGLTPKLSRSRFRHEHGEPPVG